MDRNFLLAVVLSMGIFTLWASWQAEQQAIREAARPVEVVTEAMPSAGRVAVAPGAEALVVVEDEGSGSVSATRPAAQRELPSAATVTPTTDLWERTFEFAHFAATLSNEGAAVTSWTLGEYTEPTAAGDTPIDLVRGSGLETGILRMPLAVSGGDLRAVRWQVESASEESVSFRIETKNGLEARKIYTFDPEGYGFHLAVEIFNRGAVSISPTFAFEWPAVARDGNDFREQTLVVRQSGSVERELLASVGSGGFFGTSDETPVFAGEIDWAGIDNRYFTAIIAPAAGRRAKVTFNAIEPERLAALELSFDPSAIAPGSSQRHEFRAFLGPKKQDELEAFGAHLETVVNRGWSLIAPLTQFFEWMLAACYSLVPNYGVAIIMLTLLVRILTLPILQLQMKSMEKMRALQPQIKELQEKHSDDKAKQSEAMMSLYRETGVNPLGGCLPMVLQLPVFIGLFYALQSSIDLRQAAFFGWMTDLSAPEALFMIPGIDLPFRLLPILMAGSMVLQQRLQPMQMDPAQARMMMIVMPIMMLVLFYSFPSGLVLYYMLSNFLGIGHQVWVGRNMRKDE